MTRPRVVTERALERMPYPQRQAIYREIGAGRVKLVADAVLAEEHEKAEQRRDARVKGAEKTNAQRAKERAAEQKRHERRVRRAEHDEDGRRKSAREIERETGVDRRKVAKILGR